MRLQIGSNENCVFMVLICIFFCFGAYSMVKAPRLTSKSENRNLNQFSHFTLGRFVNGSFQNDFENAISDQFVFSEKIRTVYGNTMNKLPTFGIDKLACSGRYTKLGGNEYQHATFDCDDYMLYVPISVTDSLVELLDRNIQKYNSINQKYDVYYYYVDESNMFDFEKGSKVIDFTKILEENLHGERGFRSLNYSSYEELKKYFYKTDHHWNYIGSYQGFVDITSMMGIENPSEPVDTFVSCDFFRGSHARDLQNYSNIEKFVFYKFDVPEHDTFINREAGEYGNLNKYIESSVDANVGDLYSYIYGTDQAEVVFDFHQPKEDNLLVISNSFDNPISVLIAQYFNKTYAVDPRRFNRDFGRDFVLSEYIEENKIDKILFVLSSRFIRDPNSNRGLEL